MGLCQSCSGDNRERKISPDHLNADKAAVGNKERTCTDVAFFILKILFLIVLMTLLIYSAVNGNPYRIINGYDDCGNICGRNNEKEHSLGCKGTDKTNERFLLIDKSDNPNDPETPYLHRECVARCEKTEGFKPFLNRCIRISEKTNEMASTMFSRTGMTNFFQEVSEDFSLCWKDMIKICAFSFCFSLIILLLFRFVIGFVVWLVLIGVCIASAFATIFLWFKWDEFRQYEVPGNEEAHERTKTYLAFAIVATVITIAICLVILVMRKRVKLVIQLFIEAGKSIADMPLLLLQPFMTLIMMTLLISVWFYVAILIESAGTFKVVNNDTGTIMQVKYEKNGSIMVARWLNVFALLYFAQFFIGCSQFIVASAVASWYFTHNKKNLDSPLLRGYTFLIRYHLGTVAFGSFIIAFVKFGRLILKIVQNAVNNPTNQVTSFLFNACQCCLLCFEKYLQYLSRNAYIISAMFGYNFCKSGQIAFQLLSMNALRVMAINSVGDFVLFLGKVFVIIATILVGLETLQNTAGVHHTWVLLLLCGVFAYLISNCFLTVYEMTIDTIFLCFCEDCEQNDGVANPYFMSRGLMDFVQNSKKTLDIDRVRSKNKAAWSGENKDMNGNYGINTVATPT